MNLTIDHVLFCLNDLTSFVSFEKLEGLDSHQSNIYHDLARGRIFGLVSAWLPQHSREENDKLKPDFEYCIRNGEINIGRVYPVALKDELLTSEPTDKVTLDVGTPGRLNTLHWSRQAVSELQSDQVEIEVCAVGLNFRVGYIPVAASPIANDWP